MAVVLLSGVMFCSAAAVIYVLFLGERVLHHFRWPKTVCFCNPETNQKPLRSVAPTPCVKLFISYWFRFLWVCKDFYRCQINQICIIVSTLLHLQVIKSHPSPSDISVLVLCLSLQWDRMGLRPALKVPGSVPLGGVLFKQGVTGNSRLSSVSTN